MPDILLYALICSCNLLKSKTGRRMTASFHAVDRGSNPLGDANKRSSVERAFESKFCAFFLFDRLPFSKAFSAAAEQSGRGVLSPSRCVRGLTDPPPPNTFGGQALPVNVYPLSTATPASRQPPALRFRVLRMRLQMYLQDMCMQLPCTKPSLPTYPK